MHQGLRQPGQPNQRDHALGDTPSDSNYTSRANNQSPESYVASDNDRGSYSSPGHTHYHCQLSGEGLPQPVSPFWGTGGSDILGSPSYDMGRRNANPSLMAYLAQSPPSTVSRPHPVTRDRVDDVPIWLKTHPSSLDFQPTPPDTILSNPMHPPTPQSSAHPPHPTPYERSHIPDWKPLQCSGEFRRRDLDERVSQPDFRLVSSSPPNRGSQSSGSMNSFSSGGATAGSKGRSWEEVMDNCEFCGKYALLSTVQEHWLNCPRRTSETPSRQGVWMTR